jgi:hypothetical protein
MGTMSRASRGRFGATPEGFSLLMATLCYWLLHVEIGWPRTHAARPGRVYMCANKAFRLALCPSYHPPLLIDIDTCRQEASLMSRLLCSALELLPPRNGSACRHCTAKIHFISTRSRTTATLLDDVVGTMGLPGITRVTCVIAPLGLLSNDCSHTTTSETVLKPRIATTRSPTCASCRHHCPSLCLITAAAIFVIMPALSHNWPEYSSPTPRLWL